MKNGALESQNGDKIDCKRVRKGSRWRLGATEATEAEKRGFSIADLSKLISLMSVKGCLIAGITLSPDAL